MSDPPPQHRRSWRRLWMWPAGFADDEARELTLLALVLGRAGDDLTSVSRGMGVAGQWRIELMGWALDRMARRWQVRANKAQRQALADHGGDRDWMEAHFRRVDTDLAEHLMARGINDLMYAEACLDAETVARVQKSRMPLQEVYVEVHDRDPRRRARAARADAAADTYPF